MVAVKGLELKLERVKRGLSLKGLQNETGVCYATLSIMESKNISCFATICKVCKFYKVDFRNYICEDQIIEDKNDTKL